MASDDGMVEFADEDELLAEFHRAGIFTDDERAEMARRQEQHERWAEYARQMQGIGNSHLARMQGAFMNDPTFAANTERLLAQQRQSFLGQFGPVLGGGLGGLLGGLGGGERHG
jgi:hypothetical protein